MNNVQIEENMNTLFKIVHASTLNVSIQALMLIHQVVDISDRASDRYYNAFYRKLLDLESKTLSKQNLILNLFYNSVKKDIHLNRMKAFVKRLIQICMYQGVPFVTGSFLLIAELMRSEKKLCLFDKTVLNIKKYS